VVLFDQDIEGSEYTMVNDMLEGGWAHLIDEMFIEVHYQHPAMQKCECYTPPTPNRAPLSLLPLLLQLLLLLLPLFDYHFPLSELILRPFFDPLLSQYGSLGTWQSVGILSLLLHKQMPTRSM